MKVFAILVHLFGASLAIPLVAQRLLSASNSNEVLLGLVNQNIPQGGAMNLLVPGMYQPQLLQKIAGLPQVPFGTRTGLAAQLPNQVAFPGQLQPVLTSNMGTQPVLLDPTLLNQQQPNQMMSYVVSYGIPKNQGQMQLFPLYPAQQQPGQTSSKQLGNQPPMEQTFGCLVPQFNGELMIPSSGLQLPTKNPDDALLFDENPTPVPINQEDKATFDVMKAP